jgi:hypothetical protein
MQVALKTITNFIERRHVSECHFGNAGMIFIDRHGEICCNEAATNRCSDEDQFIRLQEEARAISGGPYFEILSYKNGTMFVLSDEHLAGISDEDLQAAILDADARREQFYEERAEEFGPRAYPAARQRA